MIGQHWKEKITPDSPRMRGVIEKSVKFNADNNALPGAYQYQ